VAGGAVELTWLKSTPMFQARNEEEFKRLRITRREEPFVFGVDYEEYFLGLDHAGAETIYDGPLEPTNGRRYSFRDDTVSAGCTYSYWIQTVRSPPVGPLPVRVRNPEVWWSYPKLMSALQSIRGDTPGSASLSVCGKTSQGLDIPLLRLGRGDRGVALVGLVHGGESGPELIVPALLRLMRDTPSVFSQVRVLVIPAVNIDARQMQVEGVPWYLRTNHQGVDLNRNFPARWEETEYGYGLDSSAPGSATYRGPYPASAPETRAVMSALRDEPLDAVFCYHSLASICGLPALAARPARDCTEYARRCGEIIDVFRKGLYPEPELGGDALTYGCSAGSLPTWLFEERRIPAFDLEGGMNPSSLAICRVDGTDASLLEEYQERHYRAIRGVLQSLAEGRL